MSWTTYTAFQIELQMSLPVCFHSCHLLIYEKAPDVVPQDDILDLCLFNTYINDIAGIDTRSKQIT